MKSAANFDRAAASYALVFGLFLGLTIWKFGNPVILDTKVPAPVSLADFLNDPWPPHWSAMMFIPLALAGLILGLRKKTGSLPNRWLWLLPLIWFGWQLLSALTTLDASLTGATLGQFAGCLLAFFSGCLLFTEKRALHLLLVGIFLAFTYCLVQAVIQRNYEFPQNRQALVEGEKSGWTNFPSALIEEMKAEQVIVTTNGMDIASPVIMKKFTQGRVYGTMVYPNALAGLILMLFPVSLAVAFRATGKLKRPIRWAVILLALFLGLAAFFWTGSKLGWLLGIGVLGLFLLRLDWPVRLKLVTVTIVLILGLGIFAVRFHNYFSAGATSVGARFDYWRAAIQTTSENPLFGTGPGTFQHSYARLKAPDSEMARLTHNDYLEQFSDSGLIGGLAYLGWIGVTFGTVARKLHGQPDIFWFAIFVGLLAWFAQSLGEFSLYVPALAWTAFTLLGSLAGLKIIEIDKKAPVN